MSTSKFRLGLTGAVSAILVFSFYACSDNTAGDDDSGTGSDGDSDTDSDTDSDSDSDSDTDVDSDTDSDTDTGDGVYEWHTFWGGGGSDCGIAIDLTEKGDLIVAGFSGASWAGPNGQISLNPFPNPAFFSPFFLKLDSDGQYQWHTFFGSAFTTAVSSIEIDNSGNIYACGGSHNWNGPNGESPLNYYAGAESGNGYVLKLDESGNYQWHTFYGSEDESDTLRSIVIGETGDLFVAGQSPWTWNGPSGELPLNPHSNPNWGDLASAMSVVKLSADGEYQWHTFWGNGIAAATAVALDVTGAPIVVGRSKTNWNGPDGQLPLNPGPDSIYNNTALLALDNDGSYRWHTFFGGDDLETKVLAYAMVTDSLGNIYLTGETSKNWNGPDGQPSINYNDQGYENYQVYYDIFVLKLDSTGDYLWHTFFGSPNTIDEDGEDDTGYALSLDNQGNLFVTGWSLDPWDGPDGQPPLNEHAGENTWEIVILKLNSEGEYQWHSFYGSPLVEDPLSVPDKGYGLVLDGNGSIFTTGVSNRPWNGPMDTPPIHAHSGNGDSFVMKLTDTF